MRHDDNGTHERNGHDGSGAGYLRIIPRAIRVSSRADGRVPMPAYRPVVYDTGRRMGVRGRKRAYPRVSAGDAAKIGATILVLVLASLRSCGAW